MHLGCGAHYAGSWCGIQGKPGKLYYGRGWFQLSWLYPMVKEYGVSAKWLLTGFGRMFEEQK